MGRFNSETVLSLRPQVFFLGPMGGTEYLGSRRAVGCDGTTWPTENSWAGRGRPWPWKCPIVSIPRMLEEDSRILEQRGGKITFVILIKLMRWQRSWISKQRPHNNTDFSWNRCGGTSPVPQWPFPNPAKVQGLSAPLLGSPRILGIQFGLFAWPAQFGPSGSYRLLPKLIFPQMTLKPPSPRTWAASTHSWPCPLASTAVFISGWSDLAWFCRCFLGGRWFHFAERKSELRGVMTLMVDGVTGVTGMMCVKGATISAVVTVVANLAAKKGSTYCRTIMPIPESSQALFLLRKHEAFEKSVHSPSGIEH